MLRTFKRILLPLSLLAGTATAAQPLFSIHYEVAYHAKPIMTLSLHASNTDQQLVLEGNFSSQGILGNLLIGSGTVKTLMQRHDNELMPDTYTVDFNNAPSRITDQQFETDDFIVTVKYEQRESRLEVPPDVHSLASMHLQLSIDAQQGKDLMYYDTVSKDKLRRYVFFRRGDEVIQTPMGTLETVRFERQRKGKTDFFYWLSPAHDYLPVKGERLRDGKVDYTMVTTSVTVENALRAMHRSTQSDGLCVEC